MSDAATSDAAIVKVEEQPAVALMRRATDVASACREIVKKTALVIQGKQYIPVEGWQSIATAYGCVAGSGEVENVDGGIRAIGMVRRISDGVLIATAEGFVGDDESTWARRPMFARRNMAQTRAISRVCRSAFAFVVTMIDEKLDVTPYEEMQAMADAEKRVKVTTTATDNLEADLAEMVGAKPPSTRMQIVDAEPSATGGPITSMDFGFGKGKPLSALTPKNLAWYDEALTQNVADPAKARYLESNKAKLAAIKAEIARRGT